MYLGFGIVELDATPEAFIEAVEAIYPDVRKVIETADVLVKDRAQSILDYQAALLYYVAKQYNGELIVELGTKYGFSTAILAQAAPDSRIITIEKYTHIMGEAGKALKQFKNVEFYNAVSWEFAEKVRDGKVGLLFVDADHKSAVRDTAAWWSRVREGGLVFYHDYNEKRFPDVIKAVNLYGEPDIIYLSEGIGMAGKFKREPS